MITSSMSFKRLMLFGVGHAMMSVAETAADTGRFAAGYHSGRDRLRPGPEGTAGGRQVRSF